MKPWITYTLIRVGLFAVVLTVLLLVGIEGWIAALAAALVGLSVSYIFFRPQRDAAIEEALSRRKSSDEEAEENL